MSGHFGTRIADAATVPGIAWLPQLSLHAILPDLVVFLDDVNMRPWGTGCATDLTEFDPRSHFVALNVWRHHYIAAAKYLPSPGDNVRPGLDLRGAAAAERLASLRRPVNVRRFQDPVQVRVQRGQPA